MNECNHNPGAFLLQKEKPSSEHVATPQGAPKVETEHLLKTVTPPIWFPIAEMRDHWARYPTPREDHPEEFRMQK